MQRLPGSVALGMSAMGDPEDSTASSGWPTSVLRALREVVGRVVAVSDTPAGGWYHGSMAAGAVCGLRPSDLRNPGLARERLWTVGKAGRPFALARRHAVTSQLAHVGALDGFVQNGGDYPALPGLRMVTYQDSTVAQAVAS